jgi:hypothetical protein
MANADLARSFSGRLATSDDRMSDIGRYAKEQNNQLKSGAAASSPNVENQLKHGLECLEKEIQGLATICLTYMSSSRDQLESLEVDLQHVEGSLQTIRSSKGRELVTAPLPSPGLKSVDDQFLPRSLKLQVDVPQNTAFTINLRALEGVGNRPEDGSDSDRPLIHKIKPGASRPLFWSRTNDFFLSGDKQGFATSFSDFYGFNGAVCFEQPAEDQSAPAQPA